VNGSSLLLLAVPASSLLAALVVFALAEERTRLRPLVNLAAAVVKLGLVASILLGVARGEAYEVRYAFLPGLDVVLRADALAMLFVTLSAVLWLLTTLYAVGYLEGSPHRSRFFGFFNLCVTSTMGIALAGNLFTFFIAYEALTLSTYPLVVHRGTARSFRAGTVYLGYTLGGGAVLLVGVVGVYRLVGAVEFVHGGVLSALGPEHHPALVVLFAILIAGLGVKAALVPLHGWLPEAMVAPAPVSALLHAVAVVKAGAFGIVRVVYDVYGIEFAADLGVLTPLAVAASVTIVYGSLRALVQDDLKRRLAFSTVSQVSYITLGVGMFGALGTTGGLVHLVHQGLMKITLFFCAGNLAETLGIKTVGQLNGVGHRMPWTMAAFTVAAFGMIGVPPMAGFISKWYLGLGAIDAGLLWVVPVLLASSALNATYFLPIVYAAWFRPQGGPWPEERAAGRLETDWRMLVPALATAGFTLAVGVLAAAPLSPLDWAKLVTLREYVR
jgi:multicomponent Na+:H+ antiporter subunit D